MWSQVKDAILQNQRFVIASHIEPDGDAVGSEMAMLHFLRGLGKEAVVLSSSETPRNLRFLDPDNEIILYDPLSPPREVREAEVIFILDISTWDRIGDLGFALELAPSIKICLDHHSNNEGFADINVVDQSASATCELVYELILYTGDRLTREIATALYTGILTDSGSFRYGKTTSRTHFMAAHLISQGVDPERVHEECFAGHTWALVRLTGLAFQTLRSDCDGKVAWIKVTRGMYQASGAVREDIEHYLNTIRAIEGVVVSVLFIELRSGLVKVLLRSRDHINVNLFAQKFGGGGHRYAAGFVLQEPMEAVIRKTMEELRKIEPCMHLE